MQPYPTDQRRTCPHCGTPGTRITRQRASGQLATYRWSCGACSRHVWLPAPAPLWAGLAVGGALLAGGLTAVFVPGLIEPEDGGSVLALVTIGLALTVWAVRYAVPMLRSPRVR